MLKWNVHLAVRGFLLAVLMGACLLSALPAGAANSSLMVGPVSGKEGSTITLNAILMSEGQAVPGKKIDFSVNGQPVGSAVTDESGLAALEGVKLERIPPGKYKKAVSAAWNGDESVPASSGSASLTVTPLEGSGASSPEGSLQGGQVVGTSQSDAALAEVPSGDSSGDRNSESIRDQVMGNPTTMWSIIAIILAVLVLGMGYWVIKHNYLHSKA